MKIHPKELEEKIRKYFLLTEIPLKQITYATRNRHGHEDDYNDAIEALRLRAEIIALLDKPSVEGKYRQSTLQELIYEEHKEIVLKRATESWESREAAENWYYNKHEGIGNKSPEEYVREGNHEEMLRVIHRLESGIY